VSIGRPSSSPTGLRCHAAAWARRIRAAPQPSGHSTFFAMQYEPGSTTSILPSSTGPTLPTISSARRFIPYPEELVLVSKLGARRDDSGGIRSAQSPEQLREGVLANLDSLRLDQVPVVNLRHPEAGVPLDEQVAAMVAMRDQGLIGAVGLSGVGPRRSGARRARVQIIRLSPAQRHPVGDSLTTPRPSD
jgi:hypothetical protein